MNDPVALMLSMLVPLACTEAAREGRPVAIDYTGAVYHLRSLTPPLAGAETIATVQPGDDAVGVCKKIATARMLGMPAPSRVAERDDRIGASRAADGPTETATEGSTSDPTSDAAERPTGQPGPLPGTTKQTTLFD